MQRVPLILEPDPDDPSGASVCVEGTIDGRPTQFVVDTGAAFTQLAAGAGTAAAGSWGDRTVGGVLGTTSVATAAIGEIRVGPLRVSGLTVGLAPADHPHPRDLLGMDVLARACWIFDFTHGSLGVAIDDVPVDAAWLPLRRWSATQPSVEVDFGGARAWAVWDSGASTTVLHDAFVRSNPDLFAATGSATGTDSAGHQELTPLVTVAPCRIAGIGFPPTTAAVVDLGALKAAADRPVDLVLGYPVIRHADWTFDFPRGRWTVTVGGQ